ncbi:acyl-CoA dehydrogenase [Nocardioides baekrokdamisoli]|uniref:Acyl-CoA dehydrogenase n=1 Tax=Nocardioides baekrokdamisoli TaxID=1804624 RepID=A0A3G9IJF0_9ACTN|nr:acyl-CoA dehydrogenase family protein [Nocardioides baekrokdamisoli]BBH18416.1 acyl-CoA dehydrogenase [Nocardioides baekrokdamisoli]
MSIGVTPDHQDLAASVVDWAQSLAGLDAVRGAEADVEATFGDVWKHVAAHGLALIAAPEGAGGGGGSLLDAAVAVSSAAEELLPGPVLSTSVTGVVAGDIAPVMATLATGGRAAVGLVASLEMAERLTGTVSVVLDAPGADWFLLGAGERWFAVPAAGVTVQASVGLDLTRRTGSVTVDAPLADVHELSASGADVRRVLVSFAAAEAAGVARRCLKIAVEYAGIREQFGQPIGKFQAIKQLCAQMLETSEAVNAAAWDVAAAATSGPEQSAYAADVAGTIAFDGAVRVAQDCIQVLGGIGFTFEHEAHFYLRRATALRAIVGSGDSFARSLAQRAVGGVRRAVDIDLDGQDEAVRAEIRAVVGTAAMAPDFCRRHALVDSGLIAPHWPAPYGRNAGPVEQIVIDQELAAAGVTLPDIKIGGWAVPTILAHGTDAQRAKFVRPTLSGDIVWCQLFSEPGAGSDLASLRTKAVRVEGGWSLTGQKVWTSLAQQADWAICLARTNPDAPQHAGITYFLVDMRSAGLDVRPLRELTGDALFNEVFLNDVFVPDELVVGEVDGGWRLARTTLANERVAMASTKLGLSVERAIELVASGSDADLARVGRMVALSTVGSLLDVRTTLRSLAGQGPGAESSVAKLLTVHVRQTASELVVDLLGPAALTDDPQVVADVHEMLLTRCLSIAGGTTQILRNVAAERILGLPR